MVCVGILMVVMAVFVVIILESIILLSILVTFLVYIFNYSAKLFEFYILLDGLYVMYCHDV